MSIKIVDEYDYLIYLIKCTINNEHPNEMPTELSFEKVFQYGVKHEVANIAFYSVEKLNHKPNDELYKEWEEVRDKAIIRTIAQSFAREEIVESFMKADVRWLEMQGTKMKKFYPKGEYRTMSDIDFIVDFENLQKCEEILRGLGYKCKNMGNEIDGYRSPNIFVEIHSEFFPETSVYYKYLNRPFEHVWHESVFFQYAILHVWKHYFNRGCGIRRILDIYLLNRKYETAFNNPAFCKSVNDSGMLEKTKQLISLGEYWFGNGTFDDKFEEMIRYVKKSEVHGTGEIQMINRVQHELEPKRNKGFRKVIYVLRRFFPGKEVMYEHFPFLKKYWMLYPIFWGVRWIKQLCTNGKLILLEIIEIIKV